MASFLFDPTCSKEQFFDDRVFLGLFNQLFDFLWLLWFLHFFSVTAVVMIKAPAQYSESAHLRS